MLLRRALVWIELRVLSQDGQFLNQYALPLSMIKEFDQLLLSFGATDAGEFETMKALHSMVKLPARMLS